MDFLEYLIAVGLFILAGLPMFGKEIKYKNVKSKILRVVFIILLILSFVIYSYVFWSRKHDEKKTKSATFETVKKVTDIDSGMQIVNDFNDSIRAKQDNILNDLTELSSSSDSLLESIGRSIKTYEKLERQAYKDYLIRKKEFNEREAKLSITHDKIKFEYSKDSTSLTLKYTLKNTGRRGLNELSVNSILLLTNNDGKISRHVITKVDSINYVSPKGEINLNTENIQVDTYREAKYVMFLMKADAFDEVSRKLIETDVVASWNNKDKRFVTKIDNKSNLKAVRNYLKKEGLSFPGI